MFLKDFYVLNLKKHIHYHVSSFLFFFLSIVYNPIPKDSIFKFSLGFDNPLWKDIGFDTSSWTDCNLASPGSVQEGTQFFRYSFSGNSNLSVFELALRYKYGIIAYINGIEIFRDNLPSGTISYQQLATGSYSTCEYHSIIRQASFASSTTCLLAIEYHFTNQVSPIIEFNSWLSFYASSIPNTGNFQILLYYNRLLSSSSFFLHFFFWWHRCSKYSKLESNFFMACSCCLFCLSLSMGSLWNEYS